MVSIIKKPSKKSYIEHKIIGTWIQESPNIIVSDPGYEKVVPEKGKKNHIFTLSTTVENVSKGKWISFIEYIPLVKRVSKIFTFKIINGKEYDTNELIENSNWIPLSIIPVDSGQVTIVDEIGFRNDNIQGFSDEKSLSKTAKDYMFDNKSGERWYGKVSSLTDGKRDAASIPYGVTTRSGWGDGMYNSFMTTSRGKVIGIRVDFIEDNEIDEIIHKYEKQKQKQKKM